LTSVHYESIMKWNVTLVSVFKGNKHKWAS